MNMCVHNEGREVDVSRFVASKSVLKLIVSRAYVHVPGICAILELHPRFQPRSSQPYLTAKTAKASVHFNDSWEDGCVLACCNDCCCLRFLEGLCWPMNIPSHYNMSNCVVTIDVPGTEHLGLGLICRRFFIFVVILLIMHQMGVAMFRAFGSAFRSITTSNTFGSFFFLSMMILGGVVAIFRIEAMVCKYCGGV